MYKISIITPSLNQDKFIEECILSVRNQSYANKEHIIIDGGSSDGTLSILKKYSDSIYWISELDRGQSDAINKGFRMASGDLIGWLNADDIYEPNIFGTVSDYFNRNPEIDMLYGDFKLINESGETIRLIQEYNFDYKALKFGINSIAGQAVFFKKSILKNTGFLDINLHYAMDYELWTRISKDFNIQHIPQVLGNFRLYSNCKSVAHPEKTKKEMDIILKRIHGKLGIKFYLVNLYYRYKRKIIKTLRLFARERYIR